MGTVTMYLHLVSGRMKISDESDDVCFFVDCSFFRRFSKHVNCFCYCFDFITSANINITWNEEFLSK